MEAASKGGRLPIAALHTLRVRWYRSQLELRIVTQYVGRLAVSGRHCPDISRCLNTVGGEAAAEMPSKILSCYNGRQTCAFLDGRIF